MQNRVLDRLRRLVLDAGDLGTLDRAPGHEAALQELLKSRSEYSSENPTTFNALQTRPHLPPDFLG